MTSKARLFYSKELKSGIISNLSKNQSHYINNVMRVKPGDKISLFNSFNGEWDAIIISNEKDFTKFKVEKFHNLSAKNTNFFYIFSKSKGALFYQINY